MQRPGKIEKPLVVGRRTDKAADEAYKQSIIFHRTNIAALHEVRRWTNNEDQRFTRVGPRTLKVGGAIGDVDPDGRFVRRLNPMAINHLVARDPRPPASTTNSASNDRAPSHRTPWTRPWRQHSSRTAMPVSNLTFGRAKVLRRIRNSKRPRLAL